MPGKAKGRGKTALLAMFESQALEAWDHPGAAKFRAGVDYTGVFTPTDVCVKATIAGGAGRRSATSPGRWSAAEAVVGDELRAIGDGPMSPAPESPKLSRLKGRRRPVG